MIYLCLIDGKKSTSTLRIVKFNIQIMASPSIYIIVTNCVTSIGCLSSNLLVV